MRPKSKRPEPTPIKRSVQYGLRRNVFRAFSPKAGRYVTFYSEPEFRHWILREWDPDIETLCEEPLEIEARYEPYSVRLTFSLWIRRRGGAETYYDVPDAADFLSAGVAGPQPSYWGGVERWCQDNGLTGAFVHPDELKAKRQLISNWIQALPHVQRACQRTDGALRQRILGALPPGQPTTLAQVERRLPNVETSVLHANVFYLVHAGQVIAAMDRMPLSRRLQLEPSDGVA